MTGEDARTSVEGAHIHTRTNPSGFRFTFGCFATSTCLVSDSRFAEFSWFPGFEWRFAHCAGCGTHLGWRFEGKGVFDALVLERLAG